MNLLPLVLALGVLTVPLTRDTLKDGIYLYRTTADQDYWTATNVVVIVNDEDVTVFDTFTRPSTTRLLIQEIRALTNKPVRTLINSHWHMDHWSGNDEFVKAFPGIQIIATAETRQYMAGMTNAFLIDPVRTALARATDPADIQEKRQFIEEMSNVPRVLPTLVFADELTFWRGRREFRVMRMMGDATGSAVLYLPQEGIVVTGDVLVAPGDGNGPPSWTTNSYAITPWLASLKRIEALNPRTIVPGQGPAFRDQSYLKLTIELFSAIIDQVHASLRRGVFRSDDLAAAVNVDAIGRRYPSGRVGPDSPFGRLVTPLIRKAAQEALDGVVR